MACVAAGVVVRAVVPPKRPFALGLACSDAVPLACADAGPTPLTCRTRPGASATVKEPVAAYAPPATRATPSTLAAPVTINLVDVFIMTFPFIAATRYRVAAITVSAQYELTRRAR